MPDVRLIPKNQVVATRIAVDMTAIRNGAKDIITAARKDLKRHDVLVSLENYPFADPDPDLADLLVEINLCNTPASRVVADYIVNEIGKLLVDQGLTDNLLVDVWMKLETGPFQELRNGQILDRLPLFNTA